MNRRDGNKIGKNLIYVVAFILITLISLGYKLFLSGTTDGLLSSKNEEDPVTIRSEETVTSEASLEEASSEVETSCAPHYVSVYICGEVNNPGVYEIASGSIINDVVLMAGGLTDNAASERINLVYIIESNISIYIPGEGENYGSNEIIRAEDQTMWGEYAVSVDGSSGTNALININTASADELMSLPGIGEVTASAIIEYRNTASFTRIEDIMNVQGIGEAKFNGIRDLICV